MAHSLNAATAAAHEIGQLRTRIDELEALLAVHTRHNATLTARLAHLQAVSAALAGLVDTDQVVTAMLNQAVPAAGARAAAVFQYQPADAAFTLLAASGFSPHHVAKLRLLPLSAATVFTDALRTGMPVYVGSPAERDARYPELGRIRQSSDSAAAGLPLIIEGQVIGCFGLVFAEAQLFLPADRAFLEAVAQQCAAALHRVLLYTQLQATSQATDEAFTLLDTLFANAPAGLGFVDRDLRFVRLNDALADINGQDVRSHLGQPLRVALPHLADQLEPLYRAVLASGQPIINMEVTGETRAAPGCERHWLVSYYPVAAPAMPPIGVGVVVVDISAIRQAEQALRTSETNLRAIFESSAQAIILIDTALQVVQWNQRAEHGVLQRFGKQFVIGAPITDYMLPETIPERLKLLQRALAGEPIETKLDLSLPSRPLWLAVTYTPVYDADRLVCGICITTLDITTEQTAENALRAYGNQMHALSVRLVHVQEDERRALAHELHDEIGQLLTGLNMVLEAGKTETTDAIRARLRSAQQVVTDLTGQVRQLSLDLRPSMLDDLGLVPTLHWHVRRYSEQTHIAVDFKHRELSGPIPPHIAIVAYRIVQEALTNVARYAQVVAVAVQVWQSHGTLTLTIEDEGCGFDVAAVLQTHRSVGLVGIRERVALLGGVFSIDSAPGEGTRLLVTLPLSQAPTPEEIA
jgi:PAS domain S-box-containing protein